MPYEYTTGTAPNENVVQGHGPGPLPADANALPFDANIRTKAHEVWLVSENALIYPGMYTIGGQWEAGDEAIAAVRWGSISLGFSYVVQVEDTPQQIAENLRNQMFNDSTFASAPIFVMPVGQYGGGYSWHICPPWSTWTANPRISLTCAKTSQHGVISIGRQPENVLDTPAMTLIQAHVVPGRAAQMNDLVSEWVAMGQTDKIEGPDDRNIRQIYARLQVYVRNPSNSAPLGRWQWQNASGNENNVQNSMMLSDGLLLCDANGQHPAGGSGGEGFMGSGTINLPSSGGIYRDGVKVL